MATFPTLSSGSMRVVSGLNTNALMKHPSTVVTTYKTNVITFVADNEQRWPVQQKLMRAELSYSRMSGYDTSILRSFFRSMRGMYVNTSYTNVFDITIDGVDYAYCTFDQDEFVVNENAQFPGTYSFTLKIKQLRKN